MPYLIPSHVIEASKLLCKGVLYAAGGQSAVANSLDMDRQYVRNWVLQGYVPLLQVYEVSRLLKVSEWALSYRRLMQVFGEKSPPFESIVRDVAIFPEEKRKILEAYRYKGSESDTS